MDVKRQDVLNKLENAVIAVTNNPVLEQSDAFIFTDGELITFDGELCTHQESPFGKEIQGSIPARSFLKMLQSFPDEKVSITIESGELLIKAGRRSSGVTLEDKILLPYNEIKVPKKFKPLTEGLTQILKQAISVCGTNESAPKTTHVHIAQDRVEATDSFCLYRAEIETGFTREALVHAKVLAAACRHNVVKVCDTQKEWLHFKTKDNMIVSLVCSTDTYYEKKLMDQLLAVKGKKILLPSNMDEILARAEIMSSSVASIESFWDKQVTVQLKKNALKITSRKDGGWFSETKKVKYAGPIMEFTIPPSFLKELVKHTRKAVINNTQIKVDDGNIHFTTVLRLEGQA